MSPLGDLLDRRAQQPAEGRVWIAGDWIVRIPSLPLDGGLAAIVRFATRCWQANVALQHADLHADRKLTMAQEALQRLSRTHLDLDVAVALAAVRAARGFLAEPPVSAADVEVGRD